MINKKKLFITFAFIVGFMIGTLSNITSDHTKKVNLPPEKVISKLNKIPVFRIRSKNNAVMKPIFFSQSEARRYVKRLNIRSPSKAEVVPVGLGNLHKLETIAFNEKKATSFIYMSDKKAISSAKTILEDKGQEHKTGIPLFTIRKKGEQGYLTIITKSSSEIPVFFEKEQLDDFLIKMEKQGLNLTDNLDVEVIFLDELIELLETEDDNYYDQITLIPSKETQLFIDQSDFAVEKNLVLKPMEHKFLGFKTTVSL